MTNIVQQYKFYQLTSKRKYELVIFNYITLEMENYNLISKCYILVNFNTADALDPSAMLKFRDKGVSKSFYNVRV